MLTDYHCHILPEMDDGAENREISEKMLDMMKMNGVGRIVLTPHFYPHREISVEDFLQKRNTAFEKISGRSDFEFYCGAEVAIERGLSEISGIEKLRIDGTDFILLELPFSGYGQWVLNEVHNLTCNTKLVPVFAHIHRYMKIYSKSQLSEILDTKAVFQVNAEALSDSRKRRFVKKLISSGTKVVFGSDSHNLTDRKPNFDLLRRKAKPEWILFSDMFFETKLYETTFSRVAEEYTGLTDKQKD